MVSVERIKEYQEITEVVDVDEDIKDVDNNGGEKDEEDVDDNSSDEEDVEDVDDNSDDEEDVENVNNNIDDDDDAGDVNDKDDDDDDAGDVDDNDDDEEDDDAFKAYMLSPQSLTLAASTYFTRGYTNTASLYKIIFIQKHEHKINTNAASLYNDYLTTCALCCPSMLMQVNKS